MHEFGEELLKAGDLDPVYNALHKVDRFEVPRTQLRRLLLSYWCCYNLGESAWISEQDDYWGAMGDMAENVIEAPIGGRWPRGRERRHFRGKAAVKSIDYLSKKYPEPETAVYYLEGLKKYEIVRNRVKEWPMFGPWIAFKVGDMLERVLGDPLDFTDSDVFFFDSPQKAAELWAGYAGGKHAIRQACAFLEEKLSDFKAPPSYDRKLGIQEFETILCKWGSHKSGHYPVGIDTRELQESLHQWAKVSPTAAGML